MRATPLGLAVLAIAWVLFAVAFALGAWGPGIAVLGVLASIASTRRPFLPPQPLLSRRLDGQRTQGSLVRVTVTGAAPTQGLVDVDVPVPLGFHLVRETHRIERGRFEVVQDMQAQVVGRPTWPPVTVRVTDAWGLAAEERQLPCDAAVTIAPDPSWAIRGRRLGLRRPVQKTIRAPIASERSLEIERVRDYRAGDTMRDIDWKATSRHQELMVREREKHVPRPATVVLDAAATMRVQRHDMKLLSAARVAYGILSAASGAGTLSHLIVAQEDKCRAVAVRGLGEAEAAVREALAACPPLSPQEATVAERSAAPVIQSLGASPGLQILVLDGEQHPEFALEMLRFTRQRGQAVLVLPASGAHLYRRGEARGKVLRSLRSWRSTRRRLQKAAAQLRVPVYILRPGNEGDVLAEVTKWLG